MSIICIACSTENQDGLSQCITCGSPLFATQLPTHYLPPNSVLQQGKYRIETVLGEGGFGITYKGIDLVNSCPVAIKENWPERANRQGTTVVWPHTTTPQSKKWQLGKVTTEASYIARCIHPNIVKVYDWFEENNTAYVVMDFISGKPLSKIIETQKKLPKDQVRRYFIQIAEALRVIHTANLLHRDIKPDNIIINQADQPILIDFGATREFIANHTGNMTALLTPGYAPLEQYTRKAKRGPATDIYALCASMYELLTGELPPDAAERVQGDTLIPLRQLISDVDPLLEQVIMTGLKIPVNDRFQSADELLKVLTGGHQIAKLISRQPLIEFMLDKSPLIIGRMEPGKVPPDINLDNFPGSETVSRPHAQIYRESGHWKIQDIGSSNGTFIKKLGQTRFSSRLITPEILTSGDEIAFGKVRFQFQHI